MAGWLELFWQPVWKKSNAKTAFRMSRANWRVGGDSFFRGSLNLSSFIMGGVYQKKRGCGSAVSHFFLKLFVPRRGYRACGVKFGTFLVYLMVFPKLHNIQMSFNRPFERYFSDPKSAKVKWIENIKRLKEGWTGESFMDILFVCDYKS